MRFKTATQGAKFAIGLGRLLEISAQTELDSARAKSQRETVEEENEDLDESSDSLSLLSTASPSMHSRSLTTLPRLLLSPGISSRGIISINRLISARRSSQLMSTRRGSQLVSPSGSARSARQNNSPAGSARSARQNNSPAGSARQNNSQLLPRRGSQLLPGRGSQFLRRGSQVGSSRRSMRTGEVDNEDAIREEPKSPIRRPSVQKAFDKEQVVLVIILHLAFVSQSFYVPKKLYVHNFPGSVEQQAYHH